MGKFKLFGSSSSGSGGGRRMGCKGSKEEGEDKGNDKNGSGPSSSGANASSSDTRIPMTAKQKYSIVASWKGIHRALEPTGVCMFVKLFQEHEELLDLFEKFGTLKTKEEQEESLELAEHATMVMNTLDHAIRSLDNPEVFVQYLENVGSGHHKIPGFNSDYFWKIEKPFLEAVKSTLEERYTENMESIYKIVIHLIIETLVKGFDNTAKKSTPSPK